MIATIDDFIKYIPTARGTYFEDIFPFLEEAKRWLEQDFFGNNLLSSIEAKGDITNEKQIVDSIICLKAYSSAIPFLDVVQTPNGFAVVSNTNQAPASKERVERLLKFVNERLYFHMDSLIEIVEADSDSLNKWELSAKFKKLTDLVYWSGSEAIRYCGDISKSFAGNDYKNAPTINYNIPYLDLQRLRSIIIGYQYQEISSYISRDYFDELINKRRSGAFTPQESEEMNSLKMIVALFLRGESFKAEEQLKLVVNSMVNKIDLYPTYAKSKEYEMKILQRYQNLEEDPTYFFL